MTYGVVGLVTVAITGLAVRIGGGGGSDGQKNQGDLRNERFYFIAWFIVEFEFDSHCTTFMLICSSAVQEWSWTIGCPAFILVS